MEHTDIVSDGESEEMVEIQKENTMYDNLLKTLGSASESLARANKRRYVDGHHFVATAAVWINTSRQLHIVFFSFCASL